MNQSLAPIIVLIRNSSKFLSECSEAKNRFAEAYFWLLTEIPYFAIFQSAKTTRSDPSRGTAGFSLKS